VLNDISVKRRPFLRSLYTGRSFFAYLQSSVFSFLSSNKAIDPFLTEFGQLYESIKRYQPRLRQDAAEKDTKKIIESLIEDILCGVHIQEKGKDYFLTKDGRKIGIANSSSGQQEMLPLAIILGVLPFIGFSPVGSSVFVEEPEAHLFPTAQKRIVELLATVFNISRQPVQFVITTHSPYILTAFNNLLQAGLVASNLRDADKEQLYSIVPQAKVLKPCDVRAYSLVAGDISNICCEDTGLIATNIIDDVSNELSIEFGHLLELEEPDGGVRRV
jgi:hypothetical protein